ncbi:hypothetical protein HK103_003248 [Boothiomyces macroporosus]|uniref:XPA C-terminal domain-containing protein n=1 Tax=Boothiomyces macroporosus TaxID=261099 RepID=A0AAD5Y4B6_9FUNG|nr:hypothetical protein HK103_003248 [Boothiomyces macroporosus]
MFKKRKIDLKYCEYDLTTMEDTRGGFLLPQEETEQKNEQEQVQLVEQGLKCQHCESIDIDVNIYKYYKEQVCLNCKKEKPELYSLLTKTECRQDYLLTESELRDQKKLPVWIKPNPHKSTYSNMLLYLRKQVEQFAFNKYGSEEMLDKEFEKKEKIKEERKVKKHKKQMNELRKKTRTTLWNSRQLEEEHKHDYQQDGDILKCSCGLSVEYEEF